MTRTETGRARSHRSSGAVLAAGSLALTLVLTGCTAASSTSAPPTAPVQSAAGSPTSAATNIASTSTSTSAPTPTRPRVTTSPHGKPTKVTATVTRTNPGQTITIGPPKPTATPAAVTGECPYLSADVVSDITGQHHGDTELVNFEPQPMCVFYRSDGVLMASARIIKATSPQQAVAAVNQHVPIADSQPASQPAGWSGGSMTSAGQMTQDSNAKSVYAVSKGNIAVVAEENESPSIKARVIAVCAIYGLKLQAGPAPDYCNGAQG